MGWVIKDTSQPLYLRERRGTYCIGGWVGLRDGLDGCGKSRPTGIRFPDLPAGIAQSLYRLSYPGSKTCCESNQYSSVGKCENFGSHFCVVDASALPRCYALLPLRGAEVLSAVPSHEFAWPDFVCILRNVSLKEGEMPLQQSSTNPKIYVPPKNSRL